MDAPTHRLLQAGNEVDGYRLEEKLHTGGMAALWRVTDLQHRHEGADLIMKVPRLYTTEDPTAIVAFEVEQMIMPKLKGRHVPRFYGAGGFDAQPYIVMERVPGESLLARFERSPLPWAEVVDIAMRVALALQDLHRQHVIHLDIKPSNIMFRPDGTAVLIDFGVARHDQLPDLLDEEFRLPFGTAPYIAPEQVLGVRREPRSDQFALGVLMYHLCTGQRPFGNPGRNKLRVRIWRDPMPPRALRPELPPWLQEVILRCLEVRPARRFDTMAQLAFVLQHHEQLPLTPRAEKLKRDGALKVLRRRFALTGVDSLFQQSAENQLSAAPIMVTALDLQCAPELADAIRRHAALILQAKPGARLACVTVRRVNRIGLDESIVRQGQNVHVKQLAELRNWARPLGFGDERVTYHVLESPDPAAAIVAYANDNGADHIVLGARGSSALRRYLGSVSSQVVAEANCAVTVIKLGPEN